MKKGILLLLLGCSVFAQGQSIKDALFSGKLKNDPGTVIRKGDDLSTKIDTSTRRKPAVDTLARIPVSAMDSATKAVAVRSDSAAVTATNMVAATDKKDTTAAASETIAPAEPAAPVAAAPAPKNNNALWKEFVDSVANTVKAEGLANKKIKKGTYYVTVTYAIETDGKVNITDVFVTPESAQLQSQVRTLLETDTPRLEPVLTSTGTPRKVTRKYNFTLTKE